MCAVLGLIDSAEIKKAGGSQTRPYDINVKGAQDKESGRPEGHPYEFNKLILL